MAKSFSVAVEIGGRVSASLGGAIKTAEDKLAGLSRSMKAQALASRAAIKDVGASMKGVAGLAAAGGIGFSLKHAFGDGAELAHEIQGMRNAGRTAHEVAEGIEAATNAIAKLPTATLTTGIKLLNETTGAFGDYHHAVENLEFNSKLADVLKNTVHVEDPAHAIGSLIKSLEIRGSASDPAKYRKESEKLTQAMTFFGGRLKPEDLYTFASNAQVGIRQLNERFLTRIAPSMIQEFGGDKVGTGLTAFRTIISGRKLSDNAQAAQWVKLGLVNKKGLNYNKQGDVKGWKDGSVKNTIGAYQDPIQFMEDTILPALQKDKVNIEDPIKLGQALNTLFKNNKANAFVTAISTVVDRARLKKDEALINKVLSVDENYDSSLLNDPRLAGAAMKGALQNIGSALTLPVMAPLAKMLVSLARGINLVSAALMRNPGAAKVVAGLVAALTALAAVRIASFVFGIAGLGRALALLMFAVPVGAAARLLGVARAIMALSAATAVGAVARVAALATSIRSLAAGMIALGAVGGSRAVLAAMGAGLLSMGRAVLMFPIAMLRAIPAALMLLVSNPIGVAVAGIVVALAALGVWVANNASGIGTFFKSFADGFMKALGPGAGGVVTSIVTGLQSVYEWLSKALGPLTDGEAKFKAWGEAAGAMAATVVNAITGLPGQVSAVAGQFAAAMADLGQQGWNAFKAVDWAGLGSALIDGIVSGIAGAAGRLTSAVGDAASRAWSAAKNALGGGGAKVAPATPGRLDARALGGPVRSGLPYLVGERGPEIFVPNGAGKVETNRTYNRLSSIGRADGPPSMRAPSAREVASSGAVSNENTTHITRGDLSVQIHVQGGGGGGDDQARQIERAVRRVLAQYESEQRGLLSD